MVTAKPSSFADWASAGTATEPSSGRKSTGHEAEDKPAAEHHNWIFQNQDNWAKFLSEFLMTPMGMTLQCDLPVFWDGEYIIFTQDIEFEFRSPSGESQINLIASSDSSIQLADGEVLVVYLDRTNTSPVTLTLQGTYASLVEGEYAIEDEANLSEDNKPLEVVLFKRDGDKLKTPINGKIYRPNLPITLGSDLAWPKWRHVRSGGDSLTISGLGSPGMCALSSTRIAMVDDANTELRAYDFLGEDWSQTGTGLSISGISGTGNPTLAALSSSRIAYFDSANEELRAYDFDGSNWTLTGSALSLGSHGTNISMTALDSDTVVISDNTNQELNVYTFNGSTWSQTGNAFTLPSYGAGGQGPRMTNLNSTDIAYTNTIDMDLTVYRWDGSDFTQLGNTLDVSTYVGQFARMASLNTQDIILIDSTNDVLIVFRWNGEDWSIECSGMELSSINANSDICALDGASVAIIDEAN